MKISTFTALSLVVVGTTGFSTVCKNQSCRNHSNSWTLQASSRRNFLSIASSAAAAAAAFVSVSQRVEALDMDAFINNTVRVCVYVCMCV